MADWIVFARSCRLRRSAAGSCHGCLASTASRARHRRGFACRPHLHGAARFPKSGTAKRDNAFRFLPDLGRRSGGPSFLRSTPAGDLDVAADRFADKHGISRSRVESRYRWVPSRATFGAYITPPLVAHPILGGQRRLGMPAEGPSADSTASHYIAVMSEPADQRKASPDMEAGRHLLFAPGAGTRNAIAPQFHEGIAPLEDARVPWLI